MFGWFVRGLGNTRNKWRQRGGRRARASRNCLVRKSCGFFLGFRSTVRRQVAPDTDIRVMFVDGPTMESHKVPLSLRAHFDD